jgi:hypothetical protein
LELAEVQLELVLEETAVMAETRALQALLHQQ